jgi:hypothetical protein
MQCGTCSIQHRRDCPRLASVWQKCKILSNWLSGFHQNLDYIQLIKEIIIIITGKVYPLVFWPQPSSEDPARFHPVFTSLDFAIIIFFYGENSSASYPTPNLEDQVPVFMLPSDRVAQLYLQHLDPFSSPSTARILTSLHTEWSKLLPDLVTAKFEPWLN